MIGKPFVKAEKLPTQLEKLLQHYDIKHPTGKLMHKHALDKNYDALAEMFDPESNARQVVLDVKDGTNLAQSIEGIKRKVVVPAVQEMPSRLASIQMDKPLPPTEEVIYNL